DQGDLGLVEGVRARRGGVQRPVGPGLANQLVQARLGDRAAPGPDVRHLGPVDVDTPDVVSVGSQAGGRHRPHVAETEHRYLHASSDLITGAGVSPTEPAHMRAEWRPVIRGEHLSIKNCGLNWPNYSK